MTREEYADFLLPDAEHEYKYYEELYKERNLSEGAIVTRFAPSPTGFVHMGSLYASFSVLQLAKQTKGVSFLRIEDTDQKREIEAGVEGILNDFKKMNISFDEDPLKGGDYGPYIQSQRKDIYKSFAKKLIIEDNAYPCFLTEEELNDIRSMQSKNNKRLGIYGKYAECRNLTIEEVIEKINNGQNYIIRFKSNGSFDNKIVLHDVIKGDIEMPENDIDHVIIKSDGLPTYHFAHVIDDHLMRTTHVLRGDEWVSSYPIHQQLFNMLGFKLPAFAHIAPITIKDGNAVRKLSKRKDKEVALSYYHELGIPSDVIRLYLATVNNSDFEEWYNKNPDKGIDDFEFRFDKMPIGGSLFDFEKLRNISRIYFSRLKADTLYNEALKYYEEYDKDFYNLMSKYKDYTIKLLNIEREIERPRKDIDSYSSIKNLITFMYDETFIKENFEIKDFYNTDILTDYIDNIYSENDTKEVWFNKIKEFAPKYGFASDNKEYKENPNKFKGNISHLCELIRVSLTFRVQTPDLYDIMVLLGKDRIKKRFIDFKNYL